MKTISYKGYLATIEPDVDDAVLVGRVINARDIIGFDGRTVEEAVHSFHAVIDEYLEDCRNRGLEPDKPYSGRFNLRLPPELHGAIAAKAAEAEKSLNQWVADALKEVVGH